jgi:4-amino-4-deoxy-L-arabinose transferase-like glycosyltransferase
MNLPPRAAVGLMRAAPALLLTAMAVLLVTSSLHKKLAYDEFDNLAYGHRFLTEGPSAEMRGQRMPVLALNAVGCLADGCRIKVLDASERRRLMVRLPTMAFTLALGLLVYRWAGELFGPRAAILALVLYAFQPTFLGHGKQVTSDVQASFFMTAAVYSFWKVLRGGGTGWPVAAGLAVAGGLASKFTGVLAVPILLAMAFTVSPREGVTPRRRAAAVLIALATAWAGINAAYLFDGTFRTAGAYDWQSEAFRQQAPPWLPIPLPQTFVLGLDYSRLLQEDPYLGRGANYVLGELNRDGRWYAFPLMILLKTPLATFPLLALALWPPRPPAPVLWLLLMPAAAVVGAFSTLVDPQLGIRYVMPALPFLVVLAGAPAREGARWRRLPWVLAAWATASALSYHPQFIAYFNELIGRRVNAYRFLADSNLDWEDHTYFIERAQRRYPHLRLVIEPEQPQAGYILVGANQLVGVIHPEKYRWLRENFRPIGHIAYSHLLFRVTSQELAALPSPAPP